MMCIPMKNKNMAAQGQLPEHKLNGCSFKSCVLYVHCFFQDFFLIRKDMAWLLILYYFLCNLTRIKMRAIQNKLDEKLLIREQINVLWYLVQLSFIFKNWGKYI